MNVLILSDIHGNLEALNSVLRDVNRNFSLDSVLLLGDIIDYGMHSNEVIKLLKNVPYPIICNIWGNHEDAVMNNHFECFSSERGHLSAEYIKKSLSAESVEYIKESMNNSGIYEFEIDGRRCLAVHGNLDNVFWKSITPDVEVDRYAKYDFVFSGHSHLPFFFEKFSKIDNPQFRNRKKTIFINPGSVGQPRNQNNKAQYALFNTSTEEVILRKTEYDIKLEQSSFHGEVDDFYRTRLEYGI